MKKLLILSIMIINAFSSENIVFINDINLNSFAKEHLGQLITYIGFIITFVVYLIIQKKKEKSSGSVLFIGLVASLLIGMICDPLKYKIF